MARTTTRSAGRRRSRGSFGQWTTDDHTGAVRDHRGWDASTLAVIDGGGCLTPTTDPTDDNTTDDNTHTGRRTPRRTRTSRKGGRR